MKILMAIYLEEYFSSADDDSRLVKLLEESGFRRRFTTLPELKDGFIVDHASIVVQRIDDPKHIAYGSGHQYGFFLELYQPLQEFSEDNPLRVFFRGLQKPRAYGARGLPPRHEIEEYINKN